MITLKRLLAKKDVQLLIQQINSAIASPIAIQDPAGNILWSDRDANRAYITEITVGNSVLGQVQGENGAAIATLLSHLAIKEMEKKDLAQETLDRYKEITLLYELSEKITTNLELQAVTELVLREAQKLVQCDRGMILLLNPETEAFEPIAMVAQSSPGSLGILQALLESGRGEIVNDVEADARSSEWEKSLRSLIAAPLKREERVIGLITLSDSTSGEYTAADLKRLGTLASQAAAAIENALLHAYKLREERIKSNLERYVPAQVVQAM
jgi:adenylate cyclase